MNYKNSKKINQRKQRAATYEVKFLVSTGNTIPLFRRWEKKYIIKGQFSNNKKFKMENI